MSPGNSSPVCRCNPGCIDLAADLVRASRGEWGLRPTPAPNVMTTSEGYRSYRLSRNPPRSRASSSARRPSPAPAWLALGRRRVPALEAVQRPLEEDPPPPLKLGHRHLRLP